MCGICKNMRVLNDSNFIRGKVPMTKRDIRIYLLDALDISRGMDVLDIGAGTGAVSVEMARAGANVTSLELNPEGIEIIKANAKKHEINLNIIEGHAPEDMPEKEFDRIFIGGSKGRLEDIIIKSYHLLKENGVVVMSFILLDNLTVANEILKKYFHDIEVTLVQTANINNIGMMMGNNPIFILRGVK